MDPHYREKLRAKVRFVGDNDLKVEVREDSYKDMVRAKHRDPAGGGPGWEITIQTDKWEQKS